MSLASSYVSVSFSTSVCIRVYPKASQLLSRGKAIILFPLKLPVGKCRQCDFSSCLWSRCHSLPLLLPLRRGNGGQEERTHRRTSGNNKKVLQACLGLRLSPLTHPTPGQSLVIHFHLQSMCVFLAALPWGMAGPVLSLWAKDMTKRIRFQ